MIIAFDGNVFTGKSSLIRAMALLKRAVVVDEQGTFLKKDTTSHTITTKKGAILLQSEYFDAEEKRCVIQKACTLNLLDRSFVSMAAHIFALNLVYGIDIRTWFLREIKKRMAMGTLILPDIFCFVKCDYETILKRILKNRDRETAPMYYKEEYFDAIEFFNQAWVGKAGGMTIDTGTVMPVQLAENLIQRLASASQGKLSTQKICVFLRDILTQRDTL